MKQNFAGQPDGGGALGYAGPFPTLTGKDLMSDVNPNQSTIFRPYPRFVDNCKTKKCMKNSMKNFDDYNNYGNEDSETNERGGGFFSLGNLNLGDLFRTGTTIYSETSRNQAMRDQAALALQIEQQKAAQAKALAQQKAAESGSYAGKIKAYTTPIIVVGVLTIGGIAAYFYFKKKKIS
jgi:hypothetical protein